MKLLPFQKSPILMCYHNKAFPFGIIQANNTDDITKWVCTKAINCVFTTRKPNHMFDMIVDDVWGSNERLVTHEDIYIDKYLMKQSAFTLLPIIKKFINDEYYVLGLYNEKYIHGKWAYELTDYYHDFLLIGCDKDKFVSVGYLSDGQFRVFEIPNKNMMDSLYQMPQPKFWLKLIKYMENAIPKANMDCVEALMNEIIDEEQRYIPDLLRVLKKNILEFRVLCNITKKILRNFLVCASEAHKN